MNFFTKMILTVFLLFGLLSIIQAQTYAYDFENATGGLTTFSSNAYSFSITSNSGGSFTIHHDGTSTGAGWNGTAVDNSYIDNINGETAGTAGSFTITKTAGPTTSFKLKSFWLYLADDVGNLQASGLVTITGKKGAATIFTVNASSGWNTDIGTAGGYTFFDLSSFGGSNNTNSYIDNFTITTASSIPYIAMDEFSWVGGTTWNGTSWDNGNPSSTIDAAIASNTAPSSFTCKNLTINSAYALNTSGITATVNGNITNSGNGINGTGTLTIASASTLSGNALTFGGILNLNAGTFASGGLLTISPGGAIKGTYSNLSGSVTLQQSIIAQRGWRMFANPFTTSQTFSSLSSTNNVTIQTSGSSNAAGIADNRVWSNSSNSWVDGGTSTSANTAYGLFIRGIKTDIVGNGTGTNYSAGPTAFTFNVNGTLNTGNYVVPAPSNSANFSIIGNPFAAPVNSSELTNGIGVPYYVYNISVSGNGRTKNGAWSAVLSSSTSTPIPVLGVIAWKPSTSYTIHTTGINTTNTPATGLFGIETPISYIELQVAENGNYQDKLYVRFDAAATLKGTDNIDLDKYYNDNVNIYSITDDKKRLAIDARNDISSIQLGINAALGAYNLSLANNTLPKGAVVYLKDKFLQTQSEMKVGDTYSFSITADTASKGEYRFELSIAGAKSSTGAIEPSLQSFTAEIMGNVTKSNTVSVKITGSKGPINIRATDMGGRNLSITQGVEGINQVQLGNISSGLLLLQFSDGKSTVTKKLIKF